MAEEKGGVRKVKVEGMREVEMEGKRRCSKMNVKTTITMKTNRKGVRADLVWQRTTTWHSPVTGVSWWRVANTNTAVLPMPLYHITPYRIHSKKRKEEKQDKCKTGEMLEKEEKQ